ncbi:hypothetical protein SAMN04488137_0556 [Fictibacillus solisalsi]|uniref:Uncharacterized protein n=1 Tax=Fictibacillus solisalsi TaxID=459525 RepID=A0A1G9TWY1_9BACL|nr:hypothetical protein SAMN04488137_0556 [Fictibacillus solisalsi]
MAGTYVWNGDLYDTKHSFVSKYGSSLLELLAPGDRSKGKTKIKCQGLLSLTFL